MSYYLDQSDPGSIKRGMSKINSEDQAQKLQAFCWVCVRAFKRSLNTQQLHNMHVEWPNQSTSTTSVENY